jgi:hypothetical protein
MKKIALFSFLGLALFAAFAAFKPHEKQSPAADQYIVISWNDLGMHCANQNFSNMCILPPYNNVKAHVIRKGDSTHLPLVMTGLSGIYVTYEIPGNSYSVGKTNFWSYAFQLFGVNLAPNVGLTGFGLTGTLLKNDTLNYQHVEGIPITAFPDATPTVENPFQLTLMKAYGLDGSLLASTQNVIPVSHEINCVSSGCHSSELEILQEHESVQGFNINNRPVFCADCHSDNALGKPGKPGIPPFSQVMHQSHGEIIHTGTTNDCYKCHPGPNTQCWRDVMHTTAGLITKCQDCHGSVSNVGNTIENGRNPWLQEPSCGAATCHGPQYAEEPGKLFRQSKGHGGLFCSTCHSSPHAILPTSHPEDNLQNLTLQGFAGTLIQCSVCHGYTPAGNGPHGIPAINSSQNITIGSGQSACNNATQVITVAGNGTNYMVLPGGSATFIAGQKISFLPGTSVQPGGHLLGYITVKGRYCNSLLPPSSPQPLAYQENIIQASDDGFVRVYPNPFYNLLTIDADPLITRGPFVIRIYGSQGQTIFSETRLSGGKITISLSGHPAGIYIVRVSTPKKSDSKKIIKQEE